jgi:hypothetical protein
LKLDEISFRELQWWLHHYCFKKTVQYCGFDRNKFAAGSVIARKGITRETK